MKLASSVVTGVVERIVPASGGKPEMVRILVHGSDDTVIEVPNVLKDSHGNTVPLVEGAHVEIVISVR
jgi:hypothetical protein